MSGVSVLGAAPPNGVLAEMVSGGAIPDSVSGGVLQDLVFEREAAAKCLRLTQDCPQQICDKASAQIPHMKELLLIHLDFIQQQSEQLTTKDKQISDLRRENDMLKLRIDRMERRVSLQKNRSSSTSSGGGGTENGLPPGGLGVASEPSGAGGRTLEAPCYVRGPGAKSPVVGDARKRRRRSADSGLGGGGRGKRPCGPDHRHYHHHHHSSSGRLEPKRNGASAKREEIGDGSPIKKDNRLITESSYYTTIGERECMWTCETQTTTRSATLEVPKWRLKVYTTSYTMEGTENLSENVFDRRHFRLSIDEKRRKRWDVQRIREQWQNERLRQREKVRLREAAGGGGAAGEESELDSFWPHPHPHLVLAVDDTVPISVFGIPIASTPVIDFSLPWLTGRDTIVKTSRSYSKRKR